MEIFNPEQIKTLSQIAKGKEFYRFSKQELKSDILTELIVSDYIDILLKNQIVKNFYGTKYCTNKKSRS